MANIFTYIKKYKEKNKIDFPLNVLDALILTDIAYLPLPFAPSNNLGENDRVEALLKKFVDDPFAYKLCIMPLSDLKFARVLIKANRWKNLLMYGYYEEIDPIKQNQFRAVSFISEDKKEVFIAYCGTDTTLVGWKENLNLFYKNQIPSQDLAVRYLEGIAKRFPDAQITLGGHSKGGNLAMYGAAFAKPEVQKRVKKIMNFDGPGFMKEELTSEGYARIKDKIITFLPRQSMVGILFGLSPDYRIIKSSGLGIYNHSLYYWKVKDNDFVYSNKISKSSIKTGMIVQKAYEDMPFEDKVIFLDNVYKLFTAGGAKTTHAISRDIKHAIRGASDAFARLSDDQQYLMVTTFLDIISNYLRRMTPEEKKARKTIEENAHKK